MKKLLGIFISLFLLNFGGCTSVSIPNNATDRSQYKAWKIFTNKQNEGFSSYDVYKLEKQVNFLDVANSKVLTEKELINKDSTIINNVFEIEKNKTEYENRIDLVEKNISTLASYKKELEKVSKITLDNKTQELPGYYYSTQMITYNINKEVYEIKPFFKNDSLIILKTNEIMTNGFGAQRIVETKSTLGHQMRLNPDSFVIPIKKIIAQNYDINQLKLEVTVVLNEVIQNDIIYFATFSSPRTLVYNQKEYTYKILSYKLLYDSQV